MVIYRAVAMNKLASFGRCPLHDLWLEDHVLVKVGLIG
jgi:hypothetical protein